MPAPKGNKNAKKPAKERAGDPISFRGPKGLKARIKKAAKKRNIKTSPWLVEAAEEKADREGVK